MAKISSAAALRLKARNKGLRVSVKGDKAQLFEFNPTVNHWMPVDNYWGVLSHPWSYQEVSEMLDARA